NGAQVRLVAPGLPDIPGTNAFNPSPAVLFVTFNLAGATQGIRDLFISNSVTGGTAKLVSAFTVLPVHACAFAVSPSSASFPREGGTGQVVVTADPPNCIWTASSDSDWITFLLRAQFFPNPILGYSVASNPGPVARTGHISVAGQTVTITQSGSTTCI